VAFLGGLRHVQEAFAMDVEHPSFAEYEARFMALAAPVDEWQGPKPALDTMTLFLCLYGENGLSPEEEFDCLDTLASNPPERLKKLVVDCDYWQEQILILP
jgi:hypothetical protein